MKFKINQIQNLVVIIMAMLLAVSPAFAEKQSADIKSFVEDNTAFALDLYSVLKKVEGNIFFSPYSLSSALAMTYAGARGKTAQEMKRTMHFTLGANKTHTLFAELAARLDSVQKKGDVQLYIANSLWPQQDYPFLPGYVSLMKEQYGVSVTPVDYAEATEKARTLINSWVEEKTREKIENLIVEGVLDPMTRLVLVNAIYFKGNWAIQFDPNQTKDSDFKLLNDEIKQVPMMHQKGVFGYREIKGAQILELPYVGGQFSMIIILPSNGTALSGLEDQLSVEKIDSWLSQVREQEVHVFLPKFKITWGTVKLNDSLKSLGMREAFDIYADFSGMDGTDDLYIGCVLHKAFVEVNEEGTEAAAATAVVMKIKSIPQIYTFRADHPFMFIIRDNTTGSILFLGRVVDPI